MYVLNDITIKNQLTYYAAIKYLVKLRQNYQLSIHFLQAHILKKKLCKADQKKDPKRDPKKNQKKDLEKFLELDPKKFQNKIIIF